MKVRLSLVATFSREILYMYYIPINHPGSENTNGGQLTGEYPSNVEASANVHSFIRIMQLLFGLQLFSELHSF